MNIDPHVSFIVIMAVLVTAYICTGLVVLRNDRQLIRQLNRTQINTPFFGFTMCIVVFLAWPFKSIWGALIWTVNEYTELLE
jgi:hypothetical protein